MASGVKIHKRPLTKTVAGGLFTSSLNYLGFFLAVYLQVAYKCTDYVSFPLLDLNMKHKPWVGLQVTKCNVFLDCS